MFQPDSLLVRFADSCFMSHSLKAIYVPRSVEALSASCFRDSSLEKIRFESKSCLKVIGEYCFKNCRSLNEICIHRSVKILARSSFACCRNLNSVRFGQGSKNRAFSGVLH
jgi:hypothetical protein